MDIKAIKDKILNGGVSEEELSKILNDLSSHPKKQGSSFLKTILKGFIDGYTTPQIWRLGLQIGLLFVIVVAIIILSYSGKIDSAMTSILMAFVIGFLFGKMK